MIAMCYSDAGSANGTFVNGVRIEQGYQLSTNDEIWLGYARGQTELLRPR